jgi:hypothetical protein
VARLKAVVSLRVQAMMVSEARAKMTEVIISYRLLRLLEAVVVLISRLHSFLVIPADFGDITYLIIYCYIIKKFYLWP